MTKSLDNKFDLWAEGGIWLVGHELPDGIGRHILAYGPTLKEALIRARELENG